MAELSDQPSAPQPPIKPKTANSKAMPLQSGQTMECGAAISTSQMAQFVQSFQQSTRRWEFVVYPAMFAFVVLAGYGFFLIYSLTGNITIIARSLDPDMAQHMQGMTQNIGELAHQIQSMTTTMHEISSKLNTLQPMLTEIQGLHGNIAAMENAITTINTSVQGLDTSVGGMEQSVAGLNNSVRVITAATDQMRLDMNSMNHNFGRPMSFMNNFMPW